MGHSIPSGGVMLSRTTSDPLRHSSEHGGIAVGAPDRRLGALEQLATAFASSESSPAHRPAPVRLEHPADPLHQLPRSDRPPTGSLGAPDSPESATVATRWSNLNSLRPAMVFAAWLAALKAFAIFHQQRGRPPVARNTRTDSTAQRLGSALLPRAAKGRVSSRRSAPAALHRAD